MAEVSILNKPLYLSLTVEPKQDARFVLKLREDLHIDNKKKHYLTVKKCVIPQIHRKFPGGILQLNNRTSFNIPPTYIYSPRDLIETLNAHLVDNGFNALIFSKKDSINTVKIVLQKGQSLKVSAHFGRLLFEGKTALQNEGKEQTVSYIFKCQKDYDEGTYFLTCNIMESVYVHSKLVPLLSTLVVHYEKNLGHTTLLWGSSEALGQIRVGRYSQINLTICDEQDQVVKLDGGFLFLHLKICT